jgi:quinoprotein glucose dehydrogenase
MYKSDAQSSSYSNLHQINKENVRTLRLAWTFDPFDGGEGAWKYAGGANDWAGMSLDEKRGMVFLALGSPSYDFYGADRKGQNLYGNCALIGGRSG